MSRYVAVERLHFAHGVICLDGSWKGDSRGNRIVGNYRFYTLEELDCR